MFSNLKEVYRAGRERGFRFGEMAVVAIGMGDEFQCVTMFTVESFAVEDDDQLEELRMAEALDCERLDRQYSPFEFTAKALNEYGDTDWSAASAWERFEEGIEAGIKCALRVHK